MDLVSNLVGYSLNKRTGRLFYGFKDCPVARRVTIERYLKRLNDISLDGTIKKPIDTTYLYFSFSQESGLPNSIKVDLSKDPVIRRQFVKDLIWQSLPKNYIIDLANYGSDITIYTPSSETLFKNWNTYKSYNIVIGTDTISIALNSISSLISTKVFSETGLNQKLISKVLNEGFLVHKKAVDSFDNALVLANQGVRKELNLFGTPRPLSYKKYYQEIKEFSEILFEIEFDNFALHKSGFKSLEPDLEYFRVGRDFNVMVFKNGHTNVNSSNGIRYSGPFFVPTKVTSDLEFLFVYPSPEKANELFKILRYGLKHYPGLERYIEVPFRTPSKSTSLKYEENEYNDLPKNLEDHLNSIKDELAQKNHFAILLLPRNFNNGEDNDETYYRLKEVLLENDIPSQFIDVRGIGLDSFSYWLPNISIAILAKIGGIPWKLNRSESRELIVGFGEKKVDGAKFVGNTVFFDNSGLIQSTDYFNAKSPEDLAIALKRSVTEYLKSTQHSPERVVIHYFKTPNKREMNRISRALIELGLDLPFVIVEVNDTRAKDFICFDRNRDFGMPISGTVWTIRPGREYVLFNNSRYETLPRHRIKEEYPIKVRIFYSDSLKPNSHLTSAIVGQVFEFSRIYWKSTRQQSKPVTITYSEMIAEFSAHFTNGKIPENGTTQNTTWFI